MEIDYKPPHQELYITQHTSSFIIISKEKVLLRILDVHGNSDNKIHRQILLLVNEMLFLKTKQRLIDKQLSLQCTNCAYIICLHSTYYTISKS